MGIYQNNSSAIVIGSNLLTFIVIAENSFDLSMTDVAFVIYGILLLPINYRDKRFFITFLSLSHHCKHTA